MAESGNSDPGGKGRGGTDGAAASSGGSLAAVQACGAGLQQVAAPPSAVPRKAWSEDRPVVQAGSWVASGYGHVTGGVAAPSVVDNGSLSASNVSRLGAGTSAGGLGGAGSCAHSPAAGGTTGMAPGGVSSGHGSRLAAPAYTYGPTTPMASVLPLLAPVRLPPSSTPSTTPAPPPPPPSASQRLHFAAGGHGITAPPGTAAPLLLAPSRTAMGAGAVQAVVLKPSTSAPPRPPSSSSSSAAGIHVPTSFVRGKAEVPLAQVWDDKGRARASADWMAVVDDADGWRKPTGPGPLASTASPWSPSSRNTAASGGAGATASWAPGVVPTLVQPVTPPKHAVTMDPGRAWDTSAASYHAASAPAEVSKPCPPASPTMSPVPHVTPHPTAMGSTSSIRSTGSLDSAWASAHDGGEGGGVVPVRRLEEYPPLRDAFHARHIGKGLFNAGNTCYMNSILQSLLHLPPFTMWCCQHAAQCRRDRPPDRWCSVCAFAELYHLSLGSTTTEHALSPTMFTKHVACINRRLRIGRQEDCHEFLLALLDRLEQHCLARTRLPHAPPHGGWQAFNPFASTPPATIPRSKLLYDALPPCTLFQGMLCSRITCLRCGRDSDTFDPVESLSLSLRGSRLSHCLEAFVAPDRLEGHNQYQCDRCHCKVDADKCMLIGKLPMVLILHLKRFSYGSYGSAKNSQHVEFGSAYNMAKWCAVSPEQRRLLKAAASGRDVPAPAPAPAAVSSENGQEGEEGKLLYRLKAVAIHAGFTSSSGHYYAMVNTPAPDGEGGASQWYCMNDSSVRPLSFDRVKQEQAYVLFFVPDNPNLVRRFNQLSHATAAASTATPSPPPSATHVTVESDSSATLSTGSMRVVPRPLPPSDSSAGVAEASSWTGTKRGRDAMASGEVQGHTSSQGLHDTPSAPPPSKRMPPPPPPPTASWPSPWAGDAVVARDPAVPQAHAVPPSPSSTLMPSPAMPLAMAGSHGGDHATHPPSSTPTPGLATYMPLLYRVAAVTAQGVSRAMSWATGSSTPASPTQSPLVSPESCPTASVDWTPAHHAQVADAVGIGEGMMPISPATHTSPEMGTCSSLVEDYADSD